MAKRLQTTLVHCLLVLLLHAQPGKARQRDWPQDSILNQEITTVNIYRDAAEPGHSTPFPEAGALAAAPITSVVTAGPAGRQPPLLRQRTIVRHSDTLSSASWSSRRLTAASQTGVTPSVVMEPLQGPAVGASSTASSCPSVYDAVSGPGCSCTVWHPVSRTANSSSSSSSGTIHSNLCPAGYRCSHSAAAAIQAAGWRFNRNVSAIRSDFRMTEGGVCVPCQLGEYCPAGSQEETQLSLSACDVKSQALTHQSTNNPDDKHRSDHDPVVQPSLVSGSCSGVKLCPGGSYCPSSAEQRPCEAGRWCPEGSIKSQPCNITGMLVWNPFRKAPGGTQLLLETLVKSSQPLDGNSCPFNATHPLNGCPSGYFCPTAAQQLPCPVGFFCPGHTSAPVPCPVLGTCITHKAAGPDWSALGVLMMLLVLVLLLMILEYVRVAGRCGRQMKSQEDNVMQLIEAVGFKMVGTHGSYEVSRAAQDKPFASHFHQVLQQQATAMQDWQVVRSARHVLSRAVSHFPHMWHRQNSNGPLGPVPVPVSTGDTVLTVAGLRDSGSESAGTLAWLDGKIHKQPTANGKKGLLHIHSMMSPFERVVADKALPIASFKAQSVEYESPRSSSGDSSEDYSINPRLTLVFRDVWVADIPLEESITGKASRWMRGLCPSRTAAADDSMYSRGRGFDSSGQPACNKAALADMFAKLERAAAAGAYFIVPGVSSRFAHSQLHTIMGPSGCGKTTLCKVLAGRLPLNRMCGDVRVLCSSAADGYHAEVELTAADSAGGAAAACNISHMTGFVPQFDQLHEALTVLENLLLAAKLRLPMSKSQHGVSASVSRHMQRQRHREVHKVVGEVMALMALTQLAHKVVGSSSDRTLSGGQRKRVAIGVELVSKPSLLWLDEPTSGLDAAVAYDVVAALKASSERGMNVLAVMHQPRCSIFNMFDTTLLLGSNGNVVYSGPQRLALSYMAFLGFRSPPNENLADFLLDVTAGVVPRPGDPDYIPSQLSTMWHKAGGIWVQQQLRREQLLQQQQLSGLQPSATAQLEDLLPTAPALDAPVDWPWRPRDLEALLARFNLLSESGAGEQVPGRGGLGGGHTYTSVLSYDGFLAFWDESGIKELLGEEQFADFIGGLCEDFAMKPDSCITKAHFIQVLKDQLRAAAAAAAGMPDEQHLLTASAHGMPLDTIKQDMDNSPMPARSAGADAEAAAPEAAAGLPASGQPRSLARTSAFAAHSQTPHIDLDVLQHAQQDALQKAEAALRHCEAADRMCSASQAAVDDTAAYEAAEAATLAAAVAAAEADALAQAAAAGCPAASAAADECGLREVTPAHTPAQLSRTCSSATAFSYGDRGAFAPGMLTCPQARLKQHAMMRQRTLEHDGRREGLLGRGPSVTAGMVQRQQQQCQQLQQQQQQCKQHMEALMKCRKARREAMAAAAQHTGLRQLSQVRSMQTGNSFVAAQPSGRTPCTSLQDARTRCLDTLGDFLAMQHSQEMGPQQQTWPDMCAAARAASIPDSLRARSGHGNSGHPVQLPTLPTLPDDKAAGGDTCGLADANGTTAGARPGGKDQAAAAAAATAAAAAVSSRKLPPVLRQLQVIVLRSSWKAVLSRTALMTDLLLTSVLGLALGVAQGRDIQPGSSLMWMVITLLAYGSITLVRSTSSYGSERHIYLQQESPAGVSVTAWVFGHQIFDMVGQLLHPMLFFAWMYVLTLTPVPAWSYFITLVAVGVYTSGLGYLVSLSVHPSNAMITGLAVALLLGGVANGVVPSRWQLQATHPLLWLGYLSYTRWGLQALYISWLIPASGAHAPATATFLSGLGFCGLEPSLLRALTSRDSGLDASKNAGISINATTSGQQQWWNMTSSQRANALAEAASATLRDSPAESRSEAAAVSAVTRLWQYYNHPDLLNQECRAAQATAVAVLLGLGLLCRVLVFVLVKYKVARKKQE